MISNFSGLPSFSTLTLGKAWVIGKFRGLIATSRVFGVGVQGVQGNWMSGKLLSAGKLSLQLKTCCLIKKEMTLHKVSTNIIRTVGYLLDKMYCKSVQFQMVCKFVT